MADDASSKIIEFIANVKTLLGEMDKKLVDLTTRIATLEKRCEILVLLDQVMANPEAKSKIEAFAKNAKEKGWSPW